MQAQSTEARYGAYLKSAEWQQLRQSALVRAGHRCQVCARTERLEVHHRRYPGDESDLTVLCGSCHDMFHHTRRGATAADRRAEATALRLAGEFRIHDLARTARVPVWRAGRAIGFLGRTGRLERVSPGVWRSAA